MVAAEVVGLAVVTEGSTPAAPVPTCGDWTVPDLLRHADAGRWAG